MTSAAFTSLLAPALDDTMELSSSPAGNHFDDDIEIDFDDYGPGVNQITDDEQMLEDVEARPATATDEVMEEDDHTTSAHVVEEIMHDDADAFQVAHADPADEELIDYDDEEYLDPDTTIQNTETSFPAPTEAHNEVEYFDEEIVRQPEESAAEQPSEAPAEEGTETVTGDSAAPDIDVPTQAAVESNAEVEVNEDDDVREPASEVVVTEQEDEVQQPVNDHHSAHGESTDIKPLHHVSATLETHLSHDPEDPLTPTDTGLHPMVLSYDGHQMPLFKSHRQPDGLLKDDNLASVSLADLILNCRQRLTTKFGENCVTDDDELVLNFPDIGLILFEGTRSASSASLNDVIDVYRQLYGNDGTDEAPPLSLALRKNTNFAGYLRGLQEAADRGVGISGLSVSEDTDHEEHRQSDVYENEYVTHAENDADGTEVGEKSAPTESILGADGVEAQDARPGEDYSEDQDYEGKPQETEAHNDDDGEYNYPNNGEYDDDEEYPDPEEDYSHGDVGEPEEDNAPDVPNASAAENVQLDSVVSSVTAHDEANDKNGEYDPDIIDWDDDSSLTAAISETNLHDGNDDFATFLTEYDETAAAEVTVAEPQKTGDQLHATPDDDDVDGNIENELDFTVDVQLGQNEDGLDLGSEGLQANHEDYAEDSYEGAGDAVQQHEQDDINAGGDSVQHDASSRIQADIIDFDDEGALEPGDNSEEFNTAFELLDDGHEEHDSNDNADGIKQLDDEASGQELVDEDDIGFDHDEYGDERVSAPITTSNSPSGKRSFEDLAEDETPDVDEQPDLKKPRSG